MGILLLQILFIKEKITIQGFECFSICTVTICQILNQKRTAPPSQIDLNTVLSILFSS